MTRSGAGQGHENAGDGGEELGILGRIADRDADGFGKTHPGHGANDDAFVEKVVGKDFRVWTDVNEKEIGFAGNGIEAEAAEFVVEALAFDTVHIGGAQNVFAIVECGKGGGLTDAGDVEGSAELVHFGDEGGMTDAVADAQAGEAVDFGEGA